MATLVELTDQVRSLSLLTTNDVSDAQIIIYINQGLTKAAGLFDWPWLQTGSTVTITGGDPEVTLPSGWARLRAVMIDGEGTRLREIQEQI